tara:strand:- start:298 stop:1086 length:789 start_codon:yes stop_codon:yes gene_type:complete
MSNYLEASNTSNNTLLEKLDDEIYDGKTYHINFKINTTDDTVKNLYNSKKTQLESSNYLEDAHKDSGVPIYMPESKTFAPMTITEVDFKVESIVYYKHKVRAYAQMVTYDDDEYVVNEDCGCVNDASGNLYTDSSGNEIQQEDHEILASQPFNSGLSKSYFEPIPYFLVPHQGIYAKKLILMNSIGLMDSSYRGNLKGYFFNTSNSAVVVNRGEKVLNVALPNLSRNYRLNLFQQEEDIEDHPIREQEIQLEYFPTPFNEIY